MKGQFIQMRYMQWQPNMHSTQETIKPSRMGMQHNIRQCKCLHKRDPVPTMRTCCRIPMQQRCTWQKTLCTICTIYHMYQSIGCLPCVLRNNIDQYRVVKQTNKQKEHPTLRIVYRNSTPGFPQRATKRWWPRGSTLRPHSLLSGAPLA